MCSLNIIVVLIIFQGLRDQIWLLSFGVGFVKTRNLCRKICCGDLVMRSSLSSRRTDTWVPVLGRLLGLYIQYCLPFNRVWFIHEVNNVINNRVIGIWLYYMLSIFLPTHICDHIRAYSIHQCPRLMTMYLPGKVWMMGFFSQWKWITRLFKSSFNSNRLDF